MSDFILPESKAFASVLAMIMGEELEISELEAFEIEEASHVALYKADSGEVASACLCSWEAATTLSCALSLVPPPTAADMLKQRKLSGIAVENLHEVMNMFSPLYMNDKTPHLRLDIVSERQKATDLSPSESKFVSFSDNRYPGGRLAFLLL